MVLGQVVYKNSSGRKQITDEVYYFKDTNNKFSIREAVNNPDLFERSNKKVLNFGVSSAAYWLKFDILNKSNAEQLIIDLNQPIIDHVEFYEVNEEGRVVEKVSMSESFPFSRRKFKIPDYLFEFNTEKNKLTTIYIRVQAKENLQTPLFVGDHNSIFTFNTRKSLVSGIYVGIMVVMILYNLFIFFIFTDRNYLKYSAYILAVLITQVSLQNYTFQYLWPNLPLFTIYSPFFLPAIVGVLGLEFFKGFLKLRENYPSEYKISLIFIPIYAVSVLIGVLGYFKLSFMMVEITAATVSIFMLVTALKVYRDGYRPALFFLIGWAAFLAGIIIYVLKDFEILPYNNFTRYTMHIGSAIEVILLSFALADRINILKKEKEESQLAALRSSQKNEKLIMEQNVLLEQKVNERTYELQKAIVDLKETQTNLVEAEKMASLGQLTAGIAHEINNPINFVSSNIQPLKMDFEDLLNTIKIYDKLQDGASLEGVIEEVKKHKDNVDFDYILTEIDQLLKGIEDGAQRTFEIVKGLKTFSYLDEAEYKHANLNEGIKSTLILLKSAINKQIDIDLHLDNNLPMIECYPGKMNQVFMNILSNAVQAILGREDLPEKRITIKTFKEQNNIKITIQDTGPGIPKDIQNKIFEPFFTTKDVGKGTGLGLSIVYNIIAKHKGKIHLESEPDQGATFTITLPISQK